MRWPAICLTVLCAATAWGQSEKLSVWPHLIDTKKCSEAHQLCEMYVHAPAIADQVSAQKCLANAALCGHSVLMLQGDDNGGGTVSGGYMRDATKKAISHLDAALKLAPQDLSIHLGRLYVLETAGEYDQMLQALNQSCSIYKGKHALDAWLGYTPDFQELGLYRVAVAYMKILNTHYPGNSDVTGNIGAFLMMDGKMDEAIVYLKKAVALAPNDPINTWDLGRAYDYNGQTTLADKWYRKGLSLQTDKKQLRENECIYAKFVADKLHQPQRACALEKANCGPKHQSACGPAATFAKPVSASPAKTK
jgi:tetratricopeptide (TPR) repeat protein